MAVQNTARKKKRGSKGALYKTTAAKKDMRWGQKEEGCLLPWKLTSLLLTLLSHPLNPPGKDKPNTQTQKPGSSVLQQKQ